MLHSCGVAKDPGTPTIVRRSLPGLSVAVSQSALIPAPHLPFATREHIRPRPGGRRAQGEKRGNLRCYVSLINGRSTTPWGSFLLIFTDSQSKRTAHSCLALRRRECSIVPDTMAAGSSRQRWRGFGRSSRSPARGHLSDRFTRGDGVTQGQCIGVRQPMMTSQGTVGPLPVIVRAASAAAFAKPPKSPLQ